MEDLYAVSKGMPKLHVYIREAEPCDEFDAGGMHMATPLKMKRPIPVHKSEADRAEAAKDCKIYLESFAGKDSVTMWMDGCGTRTPRPGALAPSQRVRLLAPSLSSSLAPPPRSLLPPSLCLVVQKRLLVVVNSVRRGQATWYKGQNEC